MALNKILVVDDSPTMLRILVNTLQKAGYGSTVTANNGREAMDVLKADGGVDLILSDWNMPEMTGIEFLKAAKADAAFKAIPFIMITSRNVKEDILEAIKSGAKDYMVKPFTVESVKEKLDLL